MTRIVVDAELLSKLRDLREPLELCNEKGVLLARLDPVIQQKEYEPGEEPPVTAEELESLEHGPYYTTEEVLAYLRSL